MVLAQILSLEFFKKKTRHSLFEIFITVLQYTLNITIFLIINYTLFITDKC